MRVCAVVVGFNHWYGDTPGDKRFTRTFAHDLKEHNPEMDLVVIDNASDKPYQSDDVDIIRLTKRVDYCAALNVGLRHYDMRYDWYITFNNDCDLIRPYRIPDALEGLSENVLYGSGWNIDETAKKHWQFSAWLVISRKILRDVGLFDVKCGAAFEDFDYEQRAMNMGYILDTAPLPVLHIDAHTRYEDQSYPYRWEQARLYFNEKHGLNLNGWYKSHEIERAKGYVTGLG